MINWDDFNYDDINWDDLKKYFEGGNTGESYFDPNDWYASGATYSYNDYKEGFDKIDGKLLNILFKDNLWLLPTSKKK